MPSAADMRWMIVAAALLLSGCAGAPKQGRVRPVADVPVKIGPPYQVRGRTYVPADDRAYDATGVASWYASESGRQTANGERFRPDWIGAAHPTLPLPSYVEVTALRAGRTILVRVNDRGPFAADRLIDLSRGAARQLGIERDGRASVRVRRVFPSEAERAVLRAGRALPLRPAVPWRQAPPPAMSPEFAGDPVTDSFLVRVATLSYADRAARLAADLGGSVTRAGSLFRVQLGPFGIIAAQAALARVRAAGYQDATLVPADPTPQFTEPER